ncbi:hypothetical protein [Novosphingobium sediminicola]|uniref:Uncharacterized protein n=1 Tax=Novosphingobium sediminicola TaxID=563162 RepID=A0A7W6G5A1_9SPHN|nr:hypothetical protein [Novosphingobium sediminicola]MBB3954043.1 hypothetical protein [Novosphingobium sediminicola]
MSGLGHHAFFPAAAGLRPSGKSADPALVLQFCCGGPVPIVKHAWKGFDGCSCCICAVRVQCGGEAQSITKVSVNSNAERAVLARRKTAGAEFLVKDHKKYQCKTIEYSKQEISLCPRSHTKILLQGPA